MKKVLWVLAILAAASLFGELVHGVLVLSHRAEPAATTVSGPTVRRAWATAAVVSAVLGALIGGRAFAEARRRFAGDPPRRRARVATGLGALAAGNGALILAVAGGGPGTGNGVVGGAMALVLGLVAVALGFLARGKEPPRHQSSSR